MTLFSDSKVFISYVQEDAEIVMRLSKELEGRGIHTWLDRNELSPGMFWKPAIRAAIRSGNYFLACFSENYVQKTKSYMNEELTIAIEELRKVPSSRVWFISLLLTPCEVPDRDIGGGLTLRDIQWLELYRDWNSGIDTIVSTICPIDPEIQSLIHSINSPSDNVCRSAIDALADKNCTQAIPEIKKVFFDEQRIHVRMTAAGALAKLGDKDCIPFFIEGLSYQGNYRNSRRALESFGSKITKDIVKHLKELSNATSTTTAKTPWDAIDNCALILANIKDQSIGPDLLDIANDTSQSLHKRKAAVFAIGKIGYKPALTSLQLIISENANDLETAAMRAILDILGDKGKELLSGHKKLEEAEKFVLWEPRDEDWD